MPAARWKPLGLAMVDEIDEITASSMKIDGNEGIGAVVVLYWAHNLMEAGIDGIQLSVISVRLRRCV